MALDRSYIADPPPGQGRVIAVFAYKHDAHLVPDLIANIAPAVQGWIAWDDRRADPRMSTEPFRRKVLLDAAREAGADWVLAPDPDERLELGLAERMGEMAARSMPPVLWTFRFCEMFAADAFRTDGVWGAKTQMRLFPVQVGEISEAPLHGSWLSNTSRLTFQDSMLRIYHLRMASARRRRHRRDYYAATDPDRRCQIIGYDYLADEREMVLQAIEPSRAFHPPFVEDDGLWSEVPKGLPPALPDPPASRLHFIDWARRRRGGAQAAHVAADLAEQSDVKPEPAMTGLSAQLALDAGKAGKAERLLSPHLDAEGTDPASTAFLRVLRARARLAQGERHGAAADLAEVAATLPESSYVSGLLDEVLRPFAPRHPQAPWRRWAGESATIHEGRDVAQALLAVVVIAVGAPAELAQAVESVLTQDSPAEVVVVNSGGGPACERLAPYLDRIRLITCPEKRFVGAARNVGIDASQARYVAFLASDCRALPGWVSGRITRHLAGAPAVGTPVVSERPDSVVSRAYNLILYSRRNPKTPPEVALRFGLSYNRSLFTELGYFSPGLRVGEDSVFNRLLDQRQIVDWAPEVITSHDDPTRFSEFMLDQVKRGIRRAAHPPYPALIRKRALWSGILRFARQRRRTAISAARRYDPQSGLRRLGTETLISLGLVADTLGVLIGTFWMARAARYARLAKRLAERAPAASCRARRAALSLNPQDVNAWLALARAVGKVEGPAGMPEVKRLCRRAADLAPQLDLPALELSDKLVSIGRSTEALPLLEQAIAGSPGTAGLWIRASDLAFAAQDPKRALFYAHGAFALAPTDHNAHRCLQNAYERLGHPRLASLHSSWIGQIDQLRLQQPHTAV